MLNALFYIYTILNNTFFNQRVVLLHILYVILGL